MRVTPTRAAICFFPMCPSSGSSATKVAAVKVPTPGMVRRSVARRARFWSASIASAMVWSIVSISHSRKARCRSTELAISGSSDGRSHGFSIAAASTSWRRRRTRSDSRSCSGAGGGVAGGCMVSANRRMMPASIASVFASLPIARAKSRTCLGLIRDIGVVGAAMPRTRACRYPPVASHTS
jgi:hypothetical protein